MEMVRTNSNRTEKARNNESTKDNAMLRRYCDIYINIVVFGARFESLILHIQGRAPC